MSEFRFKQFSIRQERAAMKVGTDGVLLGAWASLHHAPDTILDIGAGTGLISLMMAQRCSATAIDAIELHAGSFEECVYNFEASPWSDRLFCYHCGFEEFADEVDDQYELILSNPPFFTEEVGSGNPSRDQARQSWSLPPEVLLRGVTRLLAPNGMFCVVWPYRQESSFLQVARQFGLYPNRLTRVSGRPEAAIKRSLMALTFKACEPVEDTLNIEVRSGQYSEAYRELVNDFYLNL